MFGKLKKMCKPAIIYFILSMVTLIVMVLSNMGNNTTFCMGSYDCPVDNLLIIYLVKLGYILFSTIILDSLCNNGYGSISWFLLFFPLFAYFASLGLFMIYKNSNSIMIQEEDWNINDEQVESFHGAWKALHKVNKINRQIRKKYNN